jgi:nucleoside-diphosphate-sugar epimerase
MSILELAETIKKIMNSDSKVELVNSPSKRYDYEVGRRWGSSEKLFKKINYKPLTNLNDGLKAIIGK